MLYDLGYILLDEELVPMPDPELGLEAPCRNQKLGRQGHRFSLALRSSSSAIALKWLGMERK